jgi:glycosyltransferase involved in cell wall biosynthesis
LNAFLQLDLPNCHLLFVGNGVLEIRLKQKGGKNQHVHFMDFQNQLNMPVVYQACDIFCLPSKGPGETWGLAINEAMASGKTIIASDKTGCAADLIKDGYNGAIFTSRNIDELKEKIQHLIQNKELLHTYGKYSTEVIAAWNFTGIALAVENKLINEKKRQD